MAITASGVYGLTLEKMLIDTAGQSLEAETHKAMLVLDAYTPDYTAHDFHADVVANEATGTGYTAGGVLLTSTEVTVAAGLLTYDAADLSWTTSTITNVMGAVGYFVVGSSATDMLIFLSDFVNVVSSSSGTLSVAWAGAGIATIDYTP